jgi:hypothetical protein
MKIIQKILRPILQYTSGVVFAWGLGNLPEFPFVIFFGWMCRIFLPSPPSPHAYDDSIGGICYLFGRFAIPPIGAILGDFFVDKLIFKYSRLIIWRMLLGLLMGIVGSAFVYFLYWILPFLGIYFLDKFPILSKAPFIEGNEPFYLIPVFFALIGYNAVGLFKDKKVKEPIL